MKIEKKKIVFGGIVLGVVIFIIAYSLYVFGGEEEEENLLDQPRVPSLKETQKEYKKKTQAVEDVKEERTRRIPSIYHEDLLDEDGFFEPGLEERKKQEILDSILIAEPQRDNPKVQEWEKTIFPDSLTVPKKSFQEQILPEEVLLAHREFFLTNSMGVSNISVVQHTDRIIYACINGDQKIRADQRVELRLVRDAVIGDSLYPKNKILYARAKLQPNRVQLKINTIDHRETALEAYDLQDGNPGIYIKNSFREEATREVLDDVVADIKIPGMPQVGEIKNIFRRNNRKLQVSLLHQYQLILKPNK